MALGTDPMDFEIYMSWMRSYYQPITDKEFTILHVGYLDEKMTQFLIRKRRLRDFRMYVQQLYPQSTTEKHRRPVYCKTILFLERMGQTCDL